MLVLALAPFQADMRMIEQSAHDSGLPSGKKLVLGMKIVSHALLLVGVKGAVYHVDANFR